MRNFFLNNKETYVVLGERKFGFWRKEEFYTQSEGERNLVLKGQRKYPLWERGTLSFVGKGIFILRGKGELYPSWERGTLSFGEEEMSVEKRARIMSSSMSSTMGSRVGAR